MFARRGAGLFLLRRLAHLSVAEGSVDGFGVQFGKGSLISQLICQGPPSTDGALYTTGSFWDVPSSGAKEALYVELQTTQGMLPHRSNFSAQFHPHGVQLMPAGLRLGNIALQEAWEGDSPLADVPVMADSVKRKRRVKIKKHKYKKRMKKLRHQLR